MDEETKQQFEEVKALIERVETRLLTEFHKWAGPVDQKLRSHREAIRALDIQGDSLTDTLRDIETRVKALEGQGGR